MAAIEDKCPCGGGYILSRGILRCEECGRTMGDVEQAPGRAASTMGVMEQESARLREENETLKRENAELRSRLARSVQSEQGEMAGRKRR